MHMTVSRYQRLSCFWQLADKLLLVHTDMGQTEHILAIHHIVHVCFYHSNFTLFGYMQTCVTSIDTATNVCIQLWCLHRR